MACLAKLPACEYMEPCLSNRLRPAVEFRHTAMCDVSSDVVTGIGGLSYPSIPQLCHVPQSAYEASGQISHVRQNLCKHSLLAGSLSIHLISLKFFLFCSFLIPSSSYFWAEFIDYLRNKLGTL